MKCRALFYLKKRIIVLSSVVLSSVVVISLLSVKEGRAVVEQV